MGTKVRYLRVGRRGVTRLSCWTWKRLEIGEITDLGGGGVCISLLTHFWG